MEKLSILGFGGSLRKGSFSGALLHAAVELVPEEARLEIFDLAPIPIFNQDFEKTPPDIVKQFKSKIKAVDAILVGTPEYNYSIPGYLKNAVDWASRPYGDNSFEGKPVAIISSSTGMLGGARAQYHLRQTFIFLDMHPVNRPEVMVTHANQKINEQGKLTDEDTRKIIRQLLESLVAWTKKLKQ